MSLREEYFERIEEDLGALAVWQPGDTVTLGTVMRKADDDRFVEYGRLSTYFSGVHRRSAVASQLAISSNHVTHRVIQSGATAADPALLDPVSTARLEIDFGDRDQFMLVTPVLRRSWYANLGEIGSQLAVDPAWDNDENYLVHEVYKASDFYFAATEDASGSMQFAGKVSGLLKLLTFGATAGLTSTSAVSINHQGRSGMIAMRLVRFDDDGDPDFLP